MIDTHSLLKRRDWLPRCEDVCKRLDVALGIMLLVSVVIIQNREDDQCKVLGKLRTENFLEELCDVLKDINTLLECEQGAYFGRVAISTTAESTQNEAVNVIVQSDAADGLNFASHVRCNSLSQAEFPSSVRLHRRMSVGVCTDERQTLWLIQPSITLHQTTFKIR